MSNGLDTFIPLANDVIEGEEEHKKLHYPQYICHPMFKSIPHRIQLIFLSSSSPTQRMFQMNEMRASGYKKRHRYVEVSTCLESTALTDKAIYAIDADAGITYQYTNCNNIQCAQLFFASRMGTKIR